MKFRGVQIGSATGIKLRIAGQKRLSEVDAQNAALPAFMELDQSEIEGLGGAGNAGSEEILRAFITRSLRAQLATESLLTRLLYVDLDFHEESQPKFFLPSGSNYHEIPTVPTSLEQLQGKALKALAKLDEIDFGALITSITDAVKATRSLVASPQLTETLVQLKDTAAAMKVAMGRIANATDHLDTHIDPVMASLRQTSDQATLTLASAQTTLTELNGTLDPESPLGYRMIHTLRTVSEASQAGTALADYLQRNPSSLIRGKATSVTKAQ